MAYWQIKYFSAIMPLRKVYSQQVSNDLIRQWYNNSRNALDANQIWRQKQKANDVKIAIQCDYVGYINEAIFDWIIPEQCGD